MLKKKEKSERTEGFIKLIRYSMCEKMCDRERGYRGNAFHYTSPEGLLGILGEKSIVLRFSRFDCMNDKNEGKEYKKVIERILKNMVIVGDISHEFFELAMDTEPRGCFTYYELIDDDSEIVETIESDQYIFCASKDEDSLALWNYYVKNNKYQGYNIEINIGGLSDDESPRGYSLDKQVVRYYDEDSFKISQYSDIVDRLKRLFEIYTCEDVYIKEQVKDLVADLKQDLKLTVKNKCFEHENEVRWILDIPKDFDAMKKINENVPEIKKKYRNVSGYIVPYVEFETSKDDLRSVGIGPLINDEAAEEMLLDYLYDTGYECVFTRKSKVPIRY